MGYSGVPPCCTTPVASANHQTDTNASRGTTESHPHHTNPPRSSGVTIVGPTTAIATHTHTQPRRTIVPKRVATQLTSACVPGPDIATAWACPTPVYTHTHTARLCTNNTHSQGHRAVCPSATLMSIRTRDRTTPGRGMQPQQRKHIGTSPPPGEDTPDRRQVQKKEKTGVHQQRVLC